MDICFNYMQKCYSFEYFVHLSPRFLLYIHHFDHFVIYFTFFHRYIFIFLILFLLFS